MFDNYTFYSHHFLAIGLAYVFLNIKTITSYALDLMLYSPGTGKIYRKFDPRTKNKSFYVNTTAGPVRLPYHKTPSLEMEIFFFNDHVIEKNSLITIQKFQELYRDEKSTMIRPHDLGIMGDIYYPEDFRGKKAVSGYISNILEDFVFVFKFENEQIDYRELFNEYERTIEYTDLADSLE